MAPKKAKNDSHSHGITRAEHTSAVADRKAMCERNIVKAIADMTQQPKKTVIEVLGGLRSLAYAELRANEKFGIPQLVTIKIRRKPAVPARTKQVFGTTMVVKAKPATKVVKTLVAKPVKVIAGCLKGLRSAEDLWAVLGPQLCWCHQCCGPSMVD